MKPNCFHDHVWLYIRCLSFPKGHIIENSSKPKYSVLALLRQLFNAQYLYGFSHRLLLSDGVF